MAILAFHTASFQYLKQDLLIGRGNKRDNNETAHESVKSFSSKAHASIYDLLNDNLRVYLPF